MSKKFDKYLEQATDSTLIEPDWDAIIACFDFVRAGEVPAKFALASIRKRLQHENPHVVTHTLLVLDACVKNCGHKMHQEIATRDFMEDFKNLATESKYEEVKSKSLEMLQCWAMAFTNKPEYKMIVDTHNLMKLAGFDFPSMKEAEAMFLAQVAPEWKDGAECFRCRTVFTIFTRKHHCRACGQIFCDVCSSRQMPLPQYGIEKEVRVCDGCFEEKISAVKKEMTKIMAGRMAHGTNGHKVGETEISAAEKEKLLREKEEEDLALAIAMSQSEAEAKEKETKKNEKLYSIYNGVQDHADDVSLASYSISEIGAYKGAAEPSVPEASTPTGSDDPLARYLDRNYWQQKKNGNVEEWAATGLGASAPPPSDPSVAPSICSTLLAPEETLNGDFANMTLTQSHFDIAPAYPDDSRQQADATIQWCQAIKDQVTIMDNRIRSNVARGRPVFNDSAIQDLFGRLTELHAQVLDRMHHLDQQRIHFETLQDQLGSITEARQAINEMRDEHERQRQERLAEEQRLRQIQMQQTLENMRMKKHAMLMEQREQALQRFQQQQMELAMRRQQAYYPQQQAGYVPSPTQVPTPQQQYYGGYPNQQSIPQPQSVPLPPPSNGSYGGVEQSRYQNYQSTYTPSPQAQPPQNYYQDQQQQAYQPQPQQPQPQPQPTTYYQQQHQPTPQPPAYQQSQQFYQQQQQQHYQQPQQPQQQNQYQAPPEQHQEQPLISFD